MRSPSTRRVCCLAALVLAALAGCPSGDGDTPPVEPPAAGPAQQRPTDVRPGERTAVDQTPEPEPPPPPTVPEVHMTDALRQTCLAFVGDPMPGGELADLAGTKQSLAELHGEKLTVVLFWTSADTVLSQIAATSALEDLQKDVAEPYGPKGVAVVAVNVHNPPETAKERVDEAGATFANLSDPEGEFFAKVATELLPRVYLLDAEGKIIWFDLEYSRATRRNLLQAIQVELGEIGEDQE